MGAKENNSTTEEYFVITADNDNIVHPVNSPSIIQRATLMQHTFIAPCGECGQDTEKTNKWWVLLFGDGHTVNVPYSVLVSWEDYSDYLDIQDMDSLLAYVNTVDGKKNVDWYEIRLGEYNAFRELRNKIYYANGGTDEDDLEYEDE